MFVKTPLCCASKENSFISDRADCEGISFDDNSNKGFIKSRNFNKIGNRPKSLTENQNKNTILFASKVTSSQRLSQSRNKDVPKEKNLRIERLLEALSCTDNAASALEAWEIISATVKALAFKSRDGREWTVPELTGEACRSDHDGSITISLIGHKIVLRRNGAYRITEIGVRSPIFQKAAACAKLA